MLISPEQIKAARALINMKQVDLAKAAGISLATLNNIERGAQSDPKISTMRAIKRAFELLGVHFFNTTQDGIGVCFQSSQQAAKTATILIIDDNEAELMLYKTWLAQCPERDYEIITATTAREGIQSYIAHQPDCIILDFMMYGADGFQFLATLRDDHADDVLPPIIFMTGMKDNAIKDRAMAEGAFDYIEKQTVTQTVLCSSVIRALDTASSRITI